jgi:hypothetical protein
METGVEVVSIICFVAVGLSHVLHPRAWVDFFTRLRDAGDAGIFAIAFLHLPLALLIAAFHHRWTGLPAVLTVIGWGWMLKATIYFVFPRFAMLGLRRVSLARAHEFVIGGWFLIALAGLLAWPHVVA